MIIDGKAIAQQVTDEVRRDVAAFVAAGHAGERVGSRRQRIEIAGEAQRAVAVAAEDRAKRREPVRAPGGEAAGDVIADPQGDQRLAPKVERAPQALAYAIGEFGGQHGADSTQRQPCHVACPVGARRATERLGSPPTA